MSGIKVIYKLRRGVAETFFVLADDNHGVMPGEQSCGARNGKELCRSDGNPVHGASCMIDSSTMGMSQKLRTPQIPNGNGSHSKNKSIFNVPNFETHSLH